MGKAKDRYRTLVDNLLNAYACCRVILDSKGEPHDFVFLEVNYSFEKVTGLQRNKIIGKKVAEVYPGATGLPCWMIGL